MWLAIQPENGWSFRLKVALWFRHRDMNCEVPPPPWIPNVFIDHSLDNWHLPDWCHAVRVSLTKAMNLSHEMGDRLDSNICCTGLCDVLKLLRSAQRYCSRTSRHLADLCYKFCDFRTRVLGPWEASGNCSGDWKKRMTKSWTNCARLGPVTVVAVVAALLDFNPVAWGVLFSCTWGLEAILFRLSNWM